MDRMILIASVYAKPFTEPVPMIPSTIAAIRVVIFPSRIADSAFFETDIDRTFHGFAGCDFFTDTCIDDNVCIDPPYRYQG